MPIFFFKSRLISRHINDYRCYMLHVYRLLIRSLQLQPFRVTLTLTFSVESHIIVLVNLDVKVCSRSSLMIADTILCSGLVKLLKLYLLKPLLGTLTVTFSVQGYLKFWLTYVSKFDLVHIDD